MLLPFFCHCERMRSNPEREEQNWIAASRKANRRFVCSFKKANKALLCFALLAMT